MPAYKKNGQKKTCLGSNKQHQLTWQLVVVPWDGFSKLQHHQNPHQAESNPGGGQGWWMVESPWVHLDTTFPTTFQILNSLVLLTFTPRNFLSLGAGKLV